MFERYTEAARRTIFFARFEASKLVSGFIDPEHLLLGLLQVDKTLASRLSLDEIRLAITRAYPSGEAISTSDDMQLSESAKAVLIAAADEAVTLQRRHVTTGHLLLGLVREKNSLASKLLIENGIDVAAMRQVAREQEPAREVPAAQSAMLALLVEQLRQLIPKSGGGFSEAEAERRIPSGLWTRKEALGHLIDWGTAHHQWLARALSEPKLIALAYPSPEWVAVMQYGTCSWLDLGELWRSMNTHLVHVFASIPEDKLDTPCVIGSDPPISLADLIIRYVAHCEETMTQILTRR